MKSSGSPEAIELGVDPAGEHGAEQRADLGRGDEVAAATGLAAGRVEAVLAVQRDGQVLVEAQRPAQRDRALDSSSAAEGTGEIGDCADLGDQAGHAHRTPACRRRMMASAAMQRAPAP